MVNRTTRRRTNRSKPVRRGRASTARRGRASTARRGRASTARRGRASTVRKSSKRRVEVVDDILSSSLGLGAMMKEDEKGYKAQGVKRKDPFKKSNSSEAYGLDDVFKEDQKGYKAQRVNKKNKSSKKGASPYNKFVKEQSPILKAENPGMKQPDIMKLIGKKWKEQK